ncbi:hypothetical protein RintRC_6885 [Richelia intracellularis]|nr:hypothetical protein RintRC_6885 [Richelia intracellularis]
MQREVTRGLLPLSKQLLGNWEVVRTNWGARCSHYFPTFLAHGI